MKNIIKTFIAIVTTIITGTTMSCSDWTDIKAKKIQNLDKTNEPKSEEYYRRLREYKKSDHAIAFGWFGFWNGGTTSGVTALRNMPDSMDIVSIWSKSWANLSEAQKKDLSYVQEVKGTRITFTVFSHNMTNLFIGNPPFPNEAKYIPDAAKALADTIFKYGYAGIDLDHECSAGNLLYNSDNMTTFLKHLRENLGPDKLILVDGKLNLITQEGWSYVDYAISQAYNTKTPSALQSKYNTIKQYVEPERFIVTENFESYWRTGGVTYTDTDGTKMPSLIGFAKWNPEEGRKGGMGTYHMEYEYAHNPDYKYIRQAIQIQNPAEVNK